MTTERMPRHEYTNFAERYLNIGSVVGVEALCTCPFHDDSNPSFQFNLESGLFICFSCGASGSIRTLERRFGVSHRSVGVGLDVLYRRIRDLERPPEGPALPREESLNQFRIPTRYWEAKRKLTKETIKQFDLGYDIANDAVTIPVRTETGTLLGVTRRYLAADAFPRYKYPKGFHKRDHLFGSWLVAEDDSITSVALTEGAIDAMWLWQCGYPAMAIYGSSISDTQIRTLQRLGIRKITLFFDNDKAGRTIVKLCCGWKYNEHADRWKKYPELDLRKKFVVENVSWVGLPARCKDANNLSPSQVRLLMRTATPLP
ncbi:DNA primase [Gordonia phage DalanDe]|nr:DNA primase [Gordonia phage DalanDe]